MQTRDLSSSNFPTQTRELGSFGSGSPIKSGTIRSVETAINSNDTAKIAAIPYGLICTRPSQTKAIMRSVGTVSHDL